MANYNSLKEAIRAAVYDNSNEDITGQILQDCLMQIINQSVVQGSLFKGLANPATNPGTPDGNVFYITGQAGTYVNFGGVIVQDKQLVILTNQTGSWQVLRLVSWADAEVPFSCDSFLSADSMNPVENRVLQSVISDLQTRVATLEQSTTTVLYRHFVKMEVGGKFFGILDIINKKQTFENSDATGTWPLLSPVIDLRYTSGQARPYFDQNFFVIISSITTQPRLIYKYYSFEQGSSSNYAHWFPTTEGTWEIASDFTFTQLAVSRIS